MNVSILFSTASLALCVFSFIFFLSYLKRRTGSERILAEFREEIDKLIAEIDGATDRDASLVEDRIKTLRTLLDDADRRISVYVRELDRRRSQEKAYADLGKTPLRHAESPAENITAIPTPSVVPQTTDAQSNAPNPPEETIHLPRIRRSLRLGLGLEVKPLSLPERVAELYRAGNSAAQISEKLGVTLAEVNLAIALLERKGR
ncbi:MAG: hypothetical protein LBG76_09875 [Treponema sp.]|jgi:hypothetical protein|nr:hypothetical protein [Treponema sp.]